MILPRISFPNLRHRALNGAEQGFTLVELMIVIVTTSLFVGLIMFFTIQYWRYGFALEADLDTFTQRLNAGDFIRDSLGTSSGLMTQNSISDSNALSADPVAGANYWLMIHAVPHNIAVPAAGSYTPVMYYRRISVNTSNVVIMNGTQPYEDEYVMYLDGTSKSLKVRTLANSFATGNKAVTSCPPAIATATCPPDKTLISNLASIDTRYFSRSGNLIDFTSIVDPITSEYIGPDYTAVEVVELTLNVAKKDAFQKVITTRSSNIIRIALRNS